MSRVHPGYDSDTESVDLRAILDSVRDRRVLRCPLDPDRRGGEYWVRELRDPAAYDEYQDYLVMHLNQSRAFCGSFPADRAWLQRAAERSVERGATLSVHTRDAWPSRFEHTLRND